MQLTTLKEGRETRDLITIFKLMNNKQETNKKDQKLRRKGKAGYLSGQNSLKEFVSTMQKSTTFPREV